MFSGSPDENIREWLDQNEHVVQSRLPGSLAPEPL